MKKLLLAAIVGLFAVGAPLPAAQADGPYWVGTCRISTVNDTTPDETLGGQNVWNGQVNIAVVATPPGNTITSARCTIRVNGGGESTILTATAAGAVAFGAGRATFTAAVTDTVEICTHVSTPAGSASNCATLTTTPICPDQVCGDGGLLDQINGQIEAVDPLICDVLKTLSGTVNSLPTNTLLYIDPATGDTYVGGTGPSALFWDCPPYVED